jgi:hypothetical protein
MGSFEINFTYQGMHYAGLATPKIYDGQEGYAVKLESENQELRNIRPISYRTNFLKLVIISTF